MSNNLRDQFPGIAKTDKALNFGWGAIQTLGWLYLVVLMVSGWHQLVTVFSPDVSRSILWATRVSVLMVLYLIAAAIYVASTGSGQGTIDILLIYPTVGFVSVVMVGGAVMLLIARIVSLFTPSKPQYTKAARYKYSAAPSSKPKQRNQHIDYTL